MLNRNDIQHHILQKAGIALMLGLLVWAIVLGQTASAMRDVQANGQSRNVAVGPLAIMRINKTIDNDGYVHARFTFTTGMAWYLLAWAALGAGVGLYAATPVKKEDSP